MIASGLGWDSNQQQLIALISRFNERTAIPGDVSGRLLIRDRKGSAVRAYDDAADVTTVAAARAQARNRATLSRAQSL